MSILILFLILKKNIISSLNGLPASYKKSGTGTFAKLKCVLYNVIRQLYLNLLTLGHGVSAQLSNNSPFEEQSPVVLSL